MIPTAKISSSHRSRLAIVQARYEADRAERAFSNVEPENHLVARTLESRAACASVRAASLVSHPQSRRCRPPIRCRYLRRDLPGLWRAETISPRDRKRLLRSLVADVTLLAEPDAQTMRIGVRWRTGATDELAVARPGPGRTPDAAARCHAYRRRARRPAHAEGLTTGKGRSLTAGGVARVRDAYKIFGPRTVGCIPWDPATQEIYRQKVANSFRLKPLPPAQRSSS